ncbi:MAG: hypothetical protein H0X24_04280 [Ktedonobacterales bacterium]|nr:hypothetical protein [Ktedonobacterales bacterium]
MALRNGPAQPSHRQIRLTRRLFSGGFGLAVVSFLGLLGLWWRNFLGNEWATVVIALALVGGLLSIGSGIMLVLHDKGDASFTELPERDPIS